MEYFYIINMFIFGIVFGSFYNVVGYRLPNNMSLVKPDSHCPICKHKLTKMELIPIFSYIIQGGKCKKCKTKIPMFYPFFEALTGILFVVNYLLFGISLELFIGLVFTSVLIIVIISDIKYMIIPDELLIFGISTILILISFLSGITGVLDAIISGTIAFSSMLTIKYIGDSLFNKESMGGGDVKLMFFTGLLLPLPISILPIFLATFIALPISIFMLLIKKEHMLAFGPYLSIAAMILFFLKITPQEFFDFMLLFS